MLILTRKQQQKIMIGDGITVTILKVKGKAVRVGIDAPQGVRILRGELVESAEFALETAASETAAGETAADEPPLASDSSATDALANEGPAGMIPQTSRLPFTSTSISLPR